MNVTIEQKRALQAARNGLAAACGEWTRRNEAYALAIEEEPKLQAEIEQIEADANYDDPGVASAYAAKQSKLQLLQRRIASQRDVASLDPKIWHPLFESAAAAVRGIVVPLYGTLLDEITVAMEPFYIQPGRAHEVARGCDKLQSFGHFTTCYWADNGSIGQGRQGLEIMDALLSGSIPWNWNGQPGFPPLEFEAEPAEATPQPATV